MKNDIVFVGASSFYTTNEFDCGSNSNGDFVFSNSNYSKLLNPEKLNKESFVLYFRGKLKNKDDLEKVWISLDDYVQYRVWYTEEGLFITESGKKISERYIYPYVSDVEKNIKKTTKSEVGEPSQLAVFFCYVVGIFIDFFDTLVCSDFFSFFLIFFFDICISFIRIVFS